MIGTKKIEYGDFQTPLDLASSIVAFLASSGESPDTILEPTCGRGSFIVASVSAFPRTRAFYGFDINSRYIKEVADNIRINKKKTVCLECKDFFKIDWLEFVGALIGRILIIGNPPWVTNSALGVFGGDNLPEKSNFQGHKGFAAKTGKANFDISEWMLIRLTEALHRRPGCVAMLCKTSTARKTLRYAWLQGLNVGRCSLHIIDAAKHFGAAVDACLLIMHTGISEAETTASVYPGLSFDGRISTLGIAGRELIADIDDYYRLRDIEGISYYTWRSGVKHDSASVMEFTRDNGHYVNGKHEECNLEPTYLFPLLKSSDLANGRLSPKKHVLLTQRKPSDDTFEISKAAPRTWAYLTAHKDALNGRQSIIYTNRPHFSVFGVGGYTFSPWKVAISGMYKSCRFEVIGAHEGKPIVLDDTCYFIPCASEREARFVSELLNSDVCQRFLRSLVFFDSKRPINIDILKRIDLRKLAKKLGREDEARNYLTSAAAYENRQSLLVFEKAEKYRVSGSRGRRSVRPADKVAPGEH